MTFAVICATTLIVQFGVLRARLWSVSTATYLSFLLAVALGLEMNPYASVGSSVAMALVFYAFLFIGHRLGRAAGLARLMPVGRVERLLNAGWLRTGLLWWFVVYPLLPVVSVLASGQSLDALLSAWTSNQTAARAQAWVEYVYTQGDVSGVAALVRGLDRQLGAFWYLGVGVAVASRSRLLYPVLLTFALVNFLVAGGTRTGIVQSLLLVALIWLLTQRRQSRRSQLSLKVLLVTGLALVTLLFTLDELMAARMGRESSGDILQRVERTLRQDVAYGGIGVDLAERSGPPTVDRTAEYTLSLIGQPIPRALWPGKPIQDPNWTMTEAYYGVDLRNIGNITLFTPLGEALFYFGLAGLAIIPLLYGFTVSALAGLYSSSRLFVGLLAQVYVWALLGMRLTYWNVFASLVSGSLLLIVLLVVVPRLSLGRSASGSTGQRVGAHWRPLPLPNAHLQSHGPTAATGGPSQT